MKVIPVIDILNGVAVHAVKGIRSQYKPLQSSLCSSSDPTDVAQAFKTLGFTDLYVAHLDAILTCTSDFTAVNGIAQATGLRLMVDGGITNMDRAGRLLESGASKLIVGTETLQNKGFVAQAVQRFGADRVVVSLDLRGGRVLAPSEFDGCSDPMCLLREFSDVGVSEVIVLDLARVGSAEGVDTGFLRRVITEVGVDVYVGGGVRGIDDLVELRAMGASGALVATALHTGKISVADLKHEGFL